MRLTLCVCRPTCHQIHPTRKRTPYYRRSFQRQPHPRKSFQDPSWGTRAGWRPRLGVCLWLWTGERDHWYHLTKSNCSQQTLSGSLCFMFLVTCPLSGLASDFVVNTCNAGSGALSVTIDGPSKVKMDFQECPEGYKVSYTPTAPGNYLISIKYGGPQHIVGSPFKAKVTGKPLSRSSNTVLSPDCAASTFIA